MLAHPKQRGLFYAKTDVGGAYRYDSASKTWIALTDWLPPDKPYLNGIDTIAIDPNDASRLYVVGGGGYGDGSKKAWFMASYDQGRNFSKVVELPFSTGGNEYGRQVGERLVVDPRDSNTLFYGTGNASANAGSNGVWKSSDGGATWNKLWSFPTLSSDNWGAGVAFIAFNQFSGQAGSPTPIIYAGVNSRDAAASGAILYKSSNGGANWSRVWTGPGNGLMPQRGLIGPDGYLYITLSKSQTYDGVDHFGPQGLTQGQVWKINVRTGADELVNITPAGVGAGFVGLSVDPSNNGVVTVNTMDRYWPVGETVFRSIDGGANWTDILPNATLDTSSSPWAATYGAPNSFGNWGGSLLDPYDPNHAFVSFGGGIWETTNLTAAKTTWAYGHNGIEETAVMDMISTPPTPWGGSFPMLTAAGDVCGFTHYNVAQSPQRQFAAPKCKDTNALDYAKNNSAIVVRVGDGNGSEPPQYGAMSWDGGYSWVPFASNGMANGASAHVAITANASSILWSSWNAPTIYSLDNGQSWTQAPGVPNTVIMSSDAQLADVFYAYDRNTGDFFKSANKGVSWTRTAKALPQWEDHMKAAPGKPNELWVAGYFGVYRSSNGGATWNKLGNVDRATGIGFGKAAAGASYPAIYMAGTVGGVTALYRSTDTGASWVRIDDARHQYGAATVVTGDPKTFGTVYLGGRGVIVGTSTN